MVNYNVEKGDEEVSEYIGCYAKDVDSKKLHAKAIILINREYPFTERENLKKIDERFQLPFDVVYFLYGFTDRIIVDELYNNKILTPTGDCTNDMKTVIKYYKQLTK